MTDTLKVTRSPTRASNQTPPLSLLEQARREGYAAGREEEKFHQAQFSDVMFDEGYQKAQDEFYNEAPSRFKWFMLGLCTAIVIMGYVGLINTDWV